MRGAASPAMPSLMVPAPLSSTTTPDMHSCKCFQYSLWVMSCGAAGNECCCRLLQADAIHRRGVYMDAEALNIRTDQLMCTLLSALTAAWLSELLPARDHEPLPRDGSSVNSRHLVELHSLPKVKYILPPCVPLTYCSNSTQGALAPFLSRLLPRPALHLTAVLLTASFILKH